jgi:glyoxylase-like metal-dependent hydrolase (beta-lactamase superfamily II)
VIHADVQEVADGVWAVLARPDRGAVGNAAIVDLDGETLVVDTHLAPAAARELWTAADEETGRQATMVLNTHWHSDHVYGNGEFADGEILATTRTRELMATVGAERLAAQKQSFELELPAELERLRAAGDEEGATSLEQYARDLAVLELTLPDETFDAERDLGRARAVTFGGGHTESDSFLLVPDASVLVAGDLVFAGLQPWVGHGDPAEWASILGQILELEWERVVPGHGPVSGRDVVEPLRDYLLALDLAVAEGGDPPEHARAWGGAEMWERNLSALRERR